MRTTNLLWALLLFAGSCTTPPDDDTTTPGETGTPSSSDTPSSRVCEPGWQDAGPDDRSSSEEDKEEHMYPGADCMACHTQGGVALKQTARSTLDPAEKLFTLAGTVFVDKEGTEPAPGVDVEITDSSGASFVLTSNSVGNFYTTRAFNPPFSARLLKDGGEHKMFSAQTNGSCNSCHQCDGQAGGKMYFSP